MCKAFDEENVINRNQNNVMIKNNNNVHLFDYTTEVIECIKLVDQAGFMS